MLSRDLSILLELQINLLVAIRHLLEHDSKVLKK